MPRKPSSRYRRPPPTPATSVARAGLVLAAMCFLPVPGGAQDSRSIREAEVPGPDPVELTVEGVRDAYARGDFTAVDLVRAFLDLIEEFEPRYNAFISMNPRAMETAAALDEAYADGRPTGPLHGVPVVVKDNINVAGMVTTAGFKGFLADSGGVDLVPAEDATVVARLREAGAVILGKTNLPDFATHGTRTRSSVAGVTLNPYNEDKVPGGSSGGTATAVNASFAVLGLGTETGGSIQNPASVQGLVGVKPTYGLVPLDGVFPMSATYVDVVGPLARTVRDAALALDVIAGPTPKDLATYAAVGKIPEDGYLAALDTTSLEGTRFGLLGPGWRESWLPLAPETDSLYRRAVRALEELGATVVEDPFAHTDFVALWDRSPRVPSQTSHDVFRYLQALGEDAAFRSVEEWEDLTGDSFPGRAGRSPPARPSATEEGDAYQAWRKELLELYRSVLEEFELDGLFFPQAGAPARNLVEDPTRPDHNPNNFPEIPSNIVNDLGVPVVTLPFAYYEDGTPFAVAFVGDRWSEARLLSWAYAFEAATRARVAPELSPPSPGPGSSRR